MFNCEGDIVHDDGDRGHDSDDSIKSGDGVALNQSPESSIRMLSPEPLELPPELSALKYPQLNKAILLMQAAAADDSEDDSEDH